MRVLLLSDWMSEPGGTEAYMRTVRDAIRSAGDEALLLACGATDAVSGVADRRAWGTDAVVPQVLLQIANPLAAKRIRDVRREFRPDVALIGHFAYHLSPSAIAALDGVPSVLAVMDHKLVCPLGSKLLPDGTICGSPAGLVCWRRGCLAPAHWLRDQARYALIRRALGRVRAVLAPSEAMREELAVHGINSRVLPLPIRSPGAAPKRRRAAEPVFLYCGRLSREKGVALLLRSFAAVQAGVPDARLRIVGDGVLREELDALASDLGLRDAVSFRGRLTPDEVGEELAGAWALVAPSLWAEPFGLVAPEAIVRHVPVIASRTGGFADSVRDGVTGLLVPNGDAAALTQAMLSVARGETFGSPLLPGDAVAQVARNHGTAAYIATLRGIFSELLGEPVRRRIGAVARG